MNKPKLAFKVDEIEIYGSSLEVARENFYNFDLVISLEKLVVKNSWKRKVSNFLRITKNPDRIEIEWRDFGIPYLDEAFWLNLVYQIEANRYKRILIHCKGGIGRTGTVLSILYGLTHYTENPINEIRNRYRADAVETHKQVEYVSNMCDISIEDIQTYY